MNLTAETMGREAMPDRYRNRSAYMRAGAGHVSVVPTGWPGLVESQGTDLVVPWE